MFSFLMFSFGSPLLPAFLILTHTALLLFEFADDLLVVSNFWPEGYLRPCEVCDNVLFQKILPITIIISKSPSRCNHRSLFQLVPSSFAAWSIASLR